MIVVTGSHDGSEQQYSTNLCLQPIPEDFDGEAKCMFDNMKSRDTFLGIPTLLVPTNGKYLVDPLSHFVISVIFLSSLALINHDEWYHSGSS